MLKVLRFSFWKPLRLNINNELGFGRHLLKDIFELKLLLHLLFLFCLFFKINIEKSAKRVSNENQYLDPFTPYWSSEVFQPETPMRISYFGIPSRWDALFRNCSLFCIVLIFYLVLQNQFFFYTNRNYDLETSKNRWVKSVLLKIVRKIPRIPKN